VALRLVNTQQKKVKLHHSIVNLVNIITLNYFHKILDPQFSLEHTLKMAEIHQCYDNCMYEGMKDTIPEQNVLY